MEREYAGEKEAGLLVDWLNGQGGTEDGKQVIGLLEKILVVERAMVTTGRPVFLKDRSALTTAPLYQPGTLRPVSIPELPGVSSVVERDASLDAVAMEINAALEAYHFWPGYTAMRHGKRSLFGWSSKVLGSEAILEIVHLGEQGLLERVRKCDQCGVKWLYARFSHQRFCSATCRDEWYLRNEGERESRRDYARKWRHKKRVKARLARKRRGGKR